MSQKRPFVNYKYINFFTPHPRRGKEFLKKKSKEKICRLAVSIMTAKRQILKIKKKSFGSVV